MDTLDSRIIASFEKNSREEVRASVDTFRGKKYIHIRVFYRSEKGEWLPGKKGLSVSANCFRDLANMVLQIGEHLKAEGFFRTQFLGDDGSASAPVADCGADMSRPIKTAPVPPEQHSSAVQKDFRTYKQAKGYYTRHRRFCVMAGSKARGYVTDALRNLKPRLVQLRDHLINEGILKEERKGDYRFASDYEFSSASAAACIVDGNPRSGYEAWGPPPED